MTATAPAPPHRRSPARAVDAIEDLRRPARPQVHALDGVTVEFEPQRSSPRSWARRVRASRRCCTASPASTASRRARSSSATSRSAALEREAPHADPARPHRLRVPVVQPRPDAHRAREHHAAARARGAQARPRVARPGHRHRAPRRPAQPPARRAVGWPAAARRGRRARCSASPRSSSPTSPPATSTRRPARRSCVHAPGGRRPRPDHR